MISCVLWWVMYFCGFACLVLKTCIHVVVKYPDRFYPGKCSQDFFLTSSVRFISVYTIILIYFISVVITVCIVLIL